MLIALVALGFLLQAAPDAAPLTDALYERVLEGDVAEVKHALDAGLLSVHSVDSLGRTPLVAACAGGRLEVVDLLLSRGADPNVQPTFGADPLRTAVHSRHLPIVERLLAAGAEVNRKARRSGTTALDEAYSVNDAKTAEFLRSKGALTGADLRLGEKVETFLEEVKGLAPEAAARRVKMAGSVLTDPVLRGCNREQSPPPVCLCRLAVLGGERALAEDPRGRTEDSDLDGEIQRALVGGKTPHAFARCASGKLQPSPPPKLQPEWFVDAESDVSVRANAVRKFGDRLQAKLNASPPTPAEEQEALALMVQARQSAERFVTLVERRRAELRADIPDIDERLKGAKTELEKQRAQEWLIAQIGLIQAWRRDRLEAEARRELAGLRLGAEVSPCKVPDSSPPPRKGWIAGCHFYYRVLHPKPDSFGAEADGVGEGKGLRYRMRRQRAGEPEAPEGLVLEMVEVH